MKLADLLKQNGIAEDVISGLPKEVMTAADTYIEGADGKLTTAQQLESQAAELRRQAELEKQEVSNYVEQYGNSLTSNANLEAENKAYKTYLESLKAQGFEITIPTVGQPAKPAVPGSPAIGDNAVDEKKILNTVGSVISQWADANNEHIRLFGVPIPDSFESLTGEASRARRTLIEVISDKYKFADKRAANAQADFDKRVNDQVQAKLAEERRKEAEARGGNPMVRPGEPSRNSFVPKIKSEEFQKSNGNVPQRERLRRVLDGVHKDLAARETA